MKYINEYLEKELRIKPLGKVTLENISNNEDNGYIVLIDDKEIGLEVWWCDYAIFLEKKLSHGLYITTPSPCNM